MVDCCCLPLLPYQFICLGAFRWNSFNFKEQVFPIALKLWVKVTALIFTFAEAPKPIEIQLSLKARVFSI